MWSIIRSWCGCNDNSKFVEEEPTNCWDVKATSFFSVDESSSFYGTRTRIPSRVDLGVHPSDHWWSDARLDATHVSEDLGVDPKILAKTIKLKVINRDEKCANELSYFDQNHISPTSRYLVLQLLLGPKIIVSIAEVLDKDLFDQIFRNDNEELNSRLKLIVNPANVSIPWSITGPKDSASIADFFGENNCSIKLKYSQKYICHAVVTIDVYSKFMIRSFLPKLAFQSGRICDFMLVDYEQRLIHTGFRIVSTDTLLDLIQNRKKAHNS